MCDCYKYMSKNDSKINIPARVVLKLDVKLLKRECSLSLEATELYLLSPSQLTTTQKERATQSD